MIDDPKASQMMAKVCAKAWSDPAYKARLLADPRTVLTQEGFNVPDGVNLKVMEDTADTQHVVLPKAPVSMAAQAVGTPQMLATKIMC